jgi:broad specificity phosphatase PhoE
MCLRCTVRLMTLRMALVVRALRYGRGLSARLMHDRPVSHQPLPAPAAAAAATTPAEEPRPRVRLLLIRHGETTFNVERRLPGQLLDVPLTDEGRRQAHRAAVALSAIPLSAVISSPLERARDTAEIMARGWGLPVRLDNRLKDTDVGRWAGQKIDELTKSDPEWRAFVAHPTEPPPGVGVESMVVVMERAVAAVEDVLRNAELGAVIAVVAHADVIKLVVGHYMGIHPDCAHRLHVDNASITALEFAGDRPPLLLALNWTAAPWWLSMPPKQRAPDAEQRTGGVEGAGAGEAAEREREAGDQDGA